MDVFEHVYVQSFVHRVFMPESTLRSPMQETDLSGKKDRAHGNKKKFTHSTGIQELTLIDGYHKLRHS